MKFEEKMKRLEEIVQKLESPNNPLEDVLKLYVEGLSLSHECKTEINNMEKQVQKVLSEYGDGNLKTGNFGENSTPDEEEDDGVPF
jgi:exodeoxyribonuclease VII small subunit